MSNERDLLRLLASVEGKSISRRELVKRGSAIGLGASALAGALGAVGGPHLFQARALAARLQDDPPPAPPGGNLTVALDWRAADPRRASDHRRRDR